MTFGNGEAIFCNRVCKRKSEGFIQSFAFLIKKSVFTAFQL